MEHSELNIVHSLLPLGGCDILLFSLLYLSSFDPNTCPSFKPFISQYGTHFLAQVLYGGIISMGSAFSSQVLHFRGSNVVSDLQLLFNLSTFSGPLTPDQQKTVEELSLLYASKLRLEGGSGTFQPNQWNQWVTTVSTNAIPISLDMRLLSSIFPSQYSNRVTALNDAIAAYLSASDPFLMRADSDDNATIDETESIDAKNQQRKIRIQNDPIVKAMVEKPGKKSRSKIETPVGWC